MNGQIVSTQNIVDDVYWLFLACSDLTHMAVKENVTLKGPVKIYAQNYLQAPAE